MLEEPELDVRGGLLGVGMLVELGEIFDRGAVGADDVGAGNGVGGFVIVLLGAGFGARLSAANLRASCTFFAVSPDGSSSLARSRPSRHGCHCNASHAARAR